MPLTPEICGVDVDKAVTLLQDGIRNPERREGRVSGLADTEIDGDERDDSRPKGPTRWITNIDAVFTLPTPPTSEPTFPFRTTRSGALRALTERRPIHAWSARGVCGGDGSALAQDSVDRSLVTPDGRSFLVQGNYEMLLAYRCSHRYALRVTR